MSRCPICGQKHKGRCAHDIPDKPDPFYVSGIWRRKRAIILRTEPLCRICRKSNTLTTATVVDHIIPIRQGGAKLDPSNLQPLCVTCHNSKTAKER
jgi:5-methylcytosine-specific restriction enzyme A